MTFFKKLFNILILVLMSTSASFSNETVAYIDIDFIIKNSNIGKITLETIKDLNNKNINLLKEKEQILKDLESEISSKKNIISKEAFEKEAVIFSEKVNRFKVEQKKMIKDFNEYKKKEIEAIFQKISPIIDSYMKKKSIKILFDSKNILMARNDINLTNEILNEINKEIK
jgi:outer membrane protein